jgi:hypothetical protein
MELDPVIIQAISEENVEKLKNEGTNLKLFLLKMEKNMETFSDNQFLQNELEKIILSEGEIKIKKPDQL